MARRWAGKKMSGDWPKETKEEKRPERLKVDYPIFSFFRFFRLSISLSSSQLRVVLIAVLAAGCASPKERQHESAVQPAVRDVPRAVRSPFILPREVTINEAAGRGAHLNVTLRLETGQSLPFSVDTGSPITLLDKSLEPRLGERLGSMPIAMVGHRMKESGSYAAPKLFLGDVPLGTGSNVWVYDFKEPRGILGMDCLRHYCIQLDFQAGKMRFLNSDRLDTTALGKAYPLTLSDMGSQGEFVYPMIHHTGLMGANTNLLIDTGCSIDGLTGRSTTCSVIWARFLSWFGTGRLHLSTWDGATYRNIKLVPVGPANVLGLRFLARHLVTLDFPKQTLYLKQTSVYPLAHKKRVGQ